MTRKPEHMTLESSKVPTYHRRLRVFCCLMSLFWVLSFLVWAHVFAWILARMMLLSFS